MSASISERIVQRETQSPNRTVADFVKEHWGADSIHEIQDFEGPSEPVILEGNWQEVQASMEWMNRSALAPLAPKMPTSRISANRINRETGEEEVVSAEMTNVEGNEPTASQVKELLQVSTKGTSLGNKNITSAVVSKVSDQQVNLMPTQAVMAKNVRAQVISNQQVNTHLTPSALKFEVPTFDKQEERRIEEILKQKEEAALLVAANVEKGVSPEKSLGSSVSKTSELALALAPTIEPSLEKAKNAVQEVLVEEEPVLDYIQDEPMLANDTVETAYQVVPIYGSNQGSSGTAFQEMKNAWDREAKEGVGAPMVMMWSNPRTNTCNYAVVPTQNAVPAIKAAPQCTRIVPHGKGRVVAHYEGGKLGSSSGPALVKFAPSGRLSARPTYCLGGRGVSRNAHQKGMENAISGKALAHSFIANANAQGGALALPATRTRVNLKSFSSQLAVAESTLKEWNVENEPRIRKNEKMHHLADAHELKEQALAELASARRDADNLEEQGFSSITVEFPKYQSPGGFFSEMAADLHHTVETGRAMKLQAQGNRDLGYSVALERGA